jgi:hypothetical protein
VHYIDDPEAPAPTVSCHPSLPSLAMTKSASCVYRSRTAISKHFQATDTTWVRKSITDTDEREVEETRYDVKVSGISAQPTQAHHGGTRTGEVCKQFSIAFTARLLGGRRRRRRRRCGQRLCSCAVLFTA